jgi:hypothetical protein
MKYSIYFSSPSLLPFGCLPIGLTGLLLLVLFGCLSIGPPGLLSLLFFGGLPIDLPRFLISGAT